MKVTEAAAELLKSIRQDAGAGDDEGVRLVPSNEQPGALGLAFRPDPEVSDEVVEESGIRVFVPEDVADELGERTLDVERSARGVSLALL